MPTLKLYPKHIFISVILLLALFLRTIDVQNTPSGFHADEASFALNAQAILKTGMDEDGISFPTTLNSYIDPKPALFSYLQIPFLAVIPDVELAARLPSALLGVLSVWLIFTLFSKISSKQVAQIAALLTAIAPWHILMSRGTQEVILSFVFFLTFLIGLQRLLFEQDEDTPLKNQIFHGLLTVISAFLSAYVYHSAKIVIPVFALVAVVFGISKNSLQAGRAAIITALIAGAILGSFFVQESSSRLAAVNIFTEAGYQRELTEQIYTATGHANLLTIRVFYNKLQTYVFALTENYVSYFSPDFLFFEGAKPTRYQIPNHGLLYLLELPLLLFGMYYSIKNKTKYGSLFWGLLFIAPIPAAVTTQEIPSMIRSFIMFIPLIYFTSLALKQIIQQKNQLVRFALILIITSGYLWSLGYFGMQYSIQAAYVEPWYRNSPYSEIADSVSQIRSDYDAVEVTNDLRPLYAYFALADVISIESLQEQPLARNQEKYTVDGITFNRSSCDFDEISENTLYIAEVGCREKNSKLAPLSVVETISYNDGTPVYELLAITE